MRNIFYKLSKKFHPDFYTLESEEKQAEILELATQNNNAYRTLSNIDTRMRYVLELKDVLDEEGKAKVPQEFLMEMMEINELLMELQFDFDQLAYTNAVIKIEQFDKNLFEQIRPVLENYKDEDATEEELLKVKDYYLKKRYLLRLRENLSNFDRT